MIHVDLVHNSFNGWGVTAVDSLDTMLLMGLEDEYARAIPTIKTTNFSLPVVRSLQVAHAAQLTLIEYRRAFLRNGHSLSGGPLVCLCAVHGQHLARQSR